MKKKSLLCLIWLSSFCFSFGRQLDSTNLLLDTFNLQDIPSIVDFEKRIRGIVVDLSSEDLIKYYKKGLEAAQKNQSDTLARIFADNTSRMYLFENDIPNMEKYAKIAIHHTEKTGRFNLIAYQYLTLAVNYLGADDLTQAIEYFLRVIEIGERHDEAKEYQHSAYISLGFSFYLLGEIEQSMSYLKLAEIFFLGYEGSSKNLYLSNVYSGIAGGFLALENKDSSDFYFNKTILALQRVESDSTLDVIDVQSITSDIYIDVIEYCLLGNRLSEANIHYEKVKDFNILDRNRMHIVDMKFALKRNELKELKRLIDFSPEGIRLMNELEYLELVAKYYEKIGDNEKSLSFFKQKNEKEIEALKNRQIKFSSFTEEKIASIKQKEKIERLAQEKTYQGTLAKTLKALAIVMAFLLTLLAYAFFQVRLKNKLLNKNIEDEKTIKLQAQKLQQAEQQKNKLFTNIAHELQTPLNIIQGLSKQMIYSDYLTEDDQESLEIINRNSTYLSETTKQILSLNLSNQEKIPSKYVLFSLSELLNYILPEFRFLALEKSITLDFEAGFNSDEYVYSDLDKITAIIKNLLSNAIKHVEEDGAILIKYSTTNEEYYELIIEDNGSGISKEELSNIFDRYYQVDNKAEGGFGLGLAICKEYIESLDGRIKVNSTLGKGSSFLIQIPKVEPERLPSLKELYAFPKNKFTELKPLKNQVEKQKEDIPHLLIVEDNIDYCKYLKTILQEKYTLAFVHSGSEALEYLKDITPTLIITDWMMRGMDGVGLVKILKASELLKNLPVLMLTARSLTSDKIKALRVGIDDYLVKPVSNDLLKDRIDYLINNVKQRQEFKSSFSLPISNPDGLELSMKDQDWLFKMEQIIFPLIQNFDLTLEQVADLGETNVTQLNRKMKALTGLTTKKYIQEIRYWEARRMLEAKEYDSVKAVCFSVGFKDQKYFSRKFKKRFGIYPSEYLHAN